MTISSDTKTYSLTTHDIILGSNQCFRRMWATFLPWQGRTSCRWYMRHYPTICGRVSRKSNFSPFDAPVRACQAMLINASVTWMPKMLPCTRRLEETTKAMYPADSMEPWGRNAEEEWRSSCQCQCNKWDWDLWVIFPCSGVEFLRTKPCPRIRSTAPTTR